MISRIDPDRELYEARLQERRDKAAERQALEAALAAQKTARETGLSEGLSEGRAEGRVEGRAEERAERWRDDIRYLQDLLGRSAVSPKELRALSLPDLEGLVAGLRAELKAKLAKDS